MGRPNEFVIPGLENVGTPGNRNVAAANQIGQALATYSRGEGAVIKSDGALATERESQVLSPNQRSVITNLQTSM